MTPCVFLSLIVLSTPGGAPVVLAQLDKLVEPLEKTLTAKLKSDAVKQEVRHCIWQTMLLVSDNSLPINLGWPMLLVEYS